jgi:DNA ligase-1
VSVLVHKAVEPDNLSVAGKKRFEGLVMSLIGGYDDVIVQPKYDGVYAQFIFDSKLGWQGFSRTGQLLKSVGQEILDPLHAFGLTERRYMGELWVPQEAHQVINGRARKQSPQWLELKLFDSVHEEPHGIIPEQYAERYDYLFEGGNISKAPNLPMVGKVFVLDDLYDQAMALRNRGASAYDGLILRDANGLFVPGKGTNGEVIKIKPRSEADLRVVGTTRGIGNRAGGIGALVVDLGGGLRNEVGTGLTMKDIAEKPKDVIGRIATIEYLGVTKDGHLREPSFKTYRFDKDEADTITPETED